MIQHYLIWFLLLLKSTVAESSLHETVSSPADSSIEAFLDRTEGDNFPLTSPSHEFDFRGCGWNNMHEGENSEDQSEKSIWDTYSSSQATIHAAVDKHLGTESSSQLNKSYRHFSSYWWCSTLGVHLEYGEVLLNKNIFSKAEYSPQPHSKQEKEGSVNHFSLEAVFKLDIPLRTHAKGEHSSEDEKGPSSSHETTTAIFPQRQVMQLNIGQGTLLQVLVNDKGHNISNTDDISGKWMHCVVHISDYFSSESAVKARLFINGVEQVEEQSNLLKTSSDKFSDLFSVLITKHDSAYLRKYESTHMLNVIGGCSNRGMIRESQSHGVEKMSAVDIENMLDQFSHPIANSTFKTKTKLFKGVEIEDTCFRGVVSYIRIWEGLLLNQDQILNLYYRSSNGMIKSKAFSDIKLTQQEKELEEARKSKMNSKDKINSIAVCLVGSVRSMATKSVQRGFMNAMSQLARPYSDEAESDKEEVDSSQSSRDIGSGYHGRVKGGCEVDVFAHVSLGKASVHAVSAVDTTQEQTAAALHSINSTGMVKVVHYFEDESHYSIPNSCSSTGAPPPQAYPQLYKVASCYHTMVLPYEAKQNRIRRQLFLEKGSKSDDLFEEFRYLFVVRTRWDLAYVTPLSPVLSLSPKFVYVPYNYWPFSDQFAIVPRSFSDSYFTAVNSFYQCVDKESYPLSLGAADLLLANHLKAANVPLILSEFHIGIARVGESPESWCGAQLHPYMIAGFFLETGALPARSFHTSIDAIKKATQCLCQHKFRSVTQEFEESRQEHGSTSDNEISESFEMKMTCGVNHLKGREVELIPGTNISWPVLPAYKLAHTDFGGIEHSALLSAPVIYPSVQRVIVDKMRKIVRDLSHLLDNILEQQQLISKHLMNVDSSSSSPSSQTYPMSSDLLTSSPISKGVPNHKLRHYLNDEDDFRKKFLKLKAEFTELESALAESTLQYSVVSNKLLEKAKYEY